jgi:VWFA-related protein
MSRRSVAAKTCVPIRAAGAVLLALASVSPASPQAPAASQTSAPAALPVFAESVDVSVVNVEVYVTGRDGKRVAGLRREDFTISEDGKPVAISNFYAVDAAETASATAPAAGSPEPAGNPTVAAPAPVPDAQHLYLAVFVDEASLTAQARNRTLPLLQGFLARKLRPGDRVLIAAYNGGVKVVQAPTADPAVLSAALAGLAKEVARGSERSADRRRVLDELELAPTTGRFAPIEAERTYGEVRLLAQAGYDQVKGTVGALGQFVESLAGLPGRKAVLLVSGGLSQRPAQALFDAWQNKFGRFAGQVGASRFDAFRQDTTRLLSELVERANASRVTFYTLALPEDLSGLPADSPGASDSTWSQDLSTTESFDTTQPLQTLAGATGGLASVEQPRFLLDRLRDDLDAYYSLGYVPTHPPDGKPHRLAVAVRGSGLTVRTREAYRARTGLQLTASRTLSALLFAEGGNPLGVSLAIEGERAATKGQYEVSLLVRLPMTKLTLVPQGGAHEGRLRVFVGARDAQGNTSDINEVALPFKVPADQLASVATHSVGTRVTLRLRSGPHTLAVGVRDELGNVDSTVTGLYTVGRLTAGDKHP